MRACLFLSRFDCDAGGGERRSGLPPRAEGTVLSLAAIFRAGKAAAGPKQRVQLPVMQDGESGHTKRKCRAVWSDCGVAKTRCSARLRPEYNLFRV